MRSQVMAASKANTNSEAMTATTMITVFDTPELVEESLFDCTDVPLPGALEEVPVAGPDDPTLDDPVPGEPVLEGPAPEDPVPGVPPPDVGCEPPGLVGLPFAPVPVCGPPEVGGELLAPELGL